MSDNTAILAGYTLEIYFWIGGVEMHLFVKPDTDFSETFKAYDADDCEFINVKGWMGVPETIKAW